MTTERKLADFSPGQKVTINEYLGHYNVPAEVVDMKPFQRRNARPLLALMIEEDAGHPKGTILYYFENELNKIQPREGDKSK